MKETDLKKVCLVSSAKPSPAPSATAFGSVGKDFAESGVVRISIRMVDANMPGSIRQQGWTLSRYAQTCKPTFADYQAEGICALARGRTDRCILGMRVRDRGVSSRSSS